MCEDAQFSFLICCLSLNRSRQGAEEKAIVTSTLAGVEIEIEMKIWPQLLRRWITFSTG